MNILGDDATIPYRKAWSQAEALLDALIIYHLVKRPVKLSKVEMAVKYARGGFKNLFYHEI